jgi:hypothetical protein
MKHEGAWCQIRAEAEGWLAALASALPLVLLHWLAWRYSEV